MRANEAPVCFYTSTAKGPVPCLICERPRSFITLLSENGFFDAIFRAKLPPPAHAPHRRFAALARATRCSSTREQASARGLLHGRRDELLTELIR